MPAIQNASAAYSPNQCHGYGYLEGGEVVLDFANYPCCPNKNCRHHLIDALPPSISSPTQLLNASSMKEYMDLCRWFSKWKKRQALRLTALPGTLSRRWCRLQRPSRNYYAVTAARRGWSSRRASAALSAASKRDKSTPGPEPPEQVHLRRLRTLVVQASSSLRIWTLMDVQQMPLLPKRATATYHAAGGRVRSQQIIRPRVPLPDMSKALNIASTMAEGRTTTTCPKYREEATDPDEQETFAPT